MSAFRTPSGNSNGNTFDFQGRQVSCEHLARRVVRYEYDSSVTVLADAYDGKPLNSPNDLVVHPDGAIWFTDPPYGTRAPGAYEGTPGGQLYLDNAVYRVEPVTGSVDRLTDEPDTPNGLCFSPDYSSLYIVDTGASRDIKVYDVVDGSRLTNGRVFTDTTVKDKRVGPDGIRADIDGNIWPSPGGGGDGYDGVVVFSPEGEPIGQILLPERCANISFGGPKRNCPFMAASQSLYAVYVNTCGAHIA